MPSAYVYKMADEVGISKEEAERRYEKAKQIVTDSYEKTEDDGEEFYALVTGVFKKSLGVKESFSRAGKLLEWFPAKEELVYFETLARKQKRIYPDAADSGVIVGLDFTKDVARKNLTSLMSVYGYKLEKSGGNSKTILFIPIEQDGESISGSVLTVFYNIDKKKNIEYMSILIKRVVTTAKEAVIEYGAKSGSG